MFILPYQDNLGHEVSNVRREISGKKVHSFQFGHLKSFSNTIDSFVNNEVPVKEDQL